jgi:WD40 repeat protein
VDHEGDAIREVCFSPDDTSFFSMGWDLTLRRWDTGTGELIPPLLREYGRLMHMELSPDNNKLLTVSWEGLVRVWDLRANQTRLRTTADHFGPGGRRLALDGSMLVLSGVDSNGSTSTLRSPMPPVSSATLLSDSLALLHVRPDQTSNRIASLQLLPAEGPPPPPTGIEVGFRGLATAPDGRSVAARYTSGNDSHLVVYSPGSSTPPVRISFPGERVRACAFGRSNVLAVATQASSAESGNAAGTLYLVDPGSGRIVSQPRTLPKPPSDLAFSPDGEHLAVATSDPSLDSCATLVWSVSHLPQLQEPPASLPHADGVLSLAFDRSSRRLATGSEDQTALIWARTNSVWVRESVRPLRCSGQVTLCAFSVNRRWLATASRIWIGRQWVSHTRLWDTRTGEPLDLETAFPVSLDRLSFVSNDDLLFAEASSLTAEPKRWLIDLASRESTNDSPRELLARAELLSGQRSFLAARSLEQARPVEETARTLDILSRTTGVGPLRPLTTNECRDLWMQLTDQAPPGLKPAPQ